MSKETEFSLTSEEITVLHWMAGFSANNIPAIYREAYNSLMKKLGARKDEKNKECLILDCDHNLLNIETGLMECEKNKDPEECEEYSEWR